MALSLPLTSAATWVGDGEAASRRVNGSTNCSWLGAYDDFDQLSGYVNQFIASGELKCAVPNDSELPMSTVTGTTVYIRYPGTPMGLANGWVKACAYDNTSSSFSCGAQSNMSTLGEKQLTPNVSEWTSNPTWNPFIYINSYAGTRTRQIYYHD